jgi:hypothetical protein
MNGIVSVKLKRGGHKVHPLKLSFGLLILLGGLLYAVNEGVVGWFAAVSGLILTLSGIEKIPHGIEFKTAAGDTEFYTNDDDEYIEKVFKALNEAFIFRG